MSKVLKFVIMTILIVAVPTSITYFLQLPPYMGFILGAISGFFGANILLQWLAHD